MGEKRVRTKTDIIYDRFKKELELKYHGKIVAIDDDLEKIVGIGESVLEVYNKAVEETGKDQFNFRRVGYSYIEYIF